MYRVHLVLTVAAQQPTRILPIDGSTLAGPVLAHLSQTLTVGITGFLDLAARARLQKVHMLSWSQTNFECVRNRLCRFPKIATIVSPVAKQQQPMLLLLHTAGNNPLQRCSWPCNMSVCLVLRHTMKQNVQQCSTPSKVFQHICVSSAA